MNLAERKVLNLLQSRKVTADEAADLIDAIRAQIDAPTRGRALASSIERSFVGHGELNQKLHVDIANAAALDGPLMVEGERGTGKMFISRTIHYNSRRSDRQFLLLDCTSESVEEELFGVEPKKRGDSTKRGLLDVARGGTIALDMMPELSPDAQRKLYSYIETGQFKRMGGSKACTSDVRIIGVCHQHLSKYVESGRFDADLHRVLTETTIVAPALRDRLEDMPALVNHFVSAKARADGRPAPGGSEDLLEKLRGYDWPNNYWELHQAIAKAVAGFKGEVLTADDVEFG